MDGKRASELFANLFLAFCLSCFLLLACFVTLLPTVPVAVFALLVALLLCFLLCSLFCLLLCSVHCFVLVLICCLLAVPFALFCLLCLVLLRVSFVAA